MRQSALIGVKDGKCDLIEFGGDWNALRDKFRSLLADCGQGKCKYDSLYWFGNAERSAKNKTFAKAPRKAEPAKAE